MDIIKTAKKNLLRKGNSVKGLAIEGYDFNKGVDYKNIIKSFKAKIPLPLSLTFLISTFIKRLN